jgi:O-antigen ligase
MLPRAARWALSITTAAAPLYVVRFRYGPVPTTLLETLVLITAALYVVAALFARGPRPRRTPLDIPIAVFLVAGVIGIFVASDHRGALGIFRAYLVEPVLMYYIAVALLAASGATDTLLATWAAGTIPFCVFDVAVFSRALVTHTLVPGHAAAAFGIDPNSIALYLEPLIGVAAGFAIFGSGKPRVLAVITLAVMLAAELATLSRGGLLALAALAVMAVVTIPNARVRITILVASAVAAAVLLVLPFIGPRLMHALDPRSGTFAVREQIWALTLKMLRDRPLFGAGINAYQSTMVPYRAGNPYLVPEPYPHNIFLSSWTEIGLLGLAAFTWLLAWLIVAPWRAYRSALRLQRPLLWGLGAAFTMLLVHGLVDTPYWKNDLSLEFWILAALSVVSIEAARKASQPA